MIGHLLRTRSGPCRVWFALCAMGMLVVLGCGNAPGGLNINGQNDPNGSGFGDNTTGETAPRFIRVPSPTGSGDANMPPPGVAISSPCDPNAPPPPPGGDDGCSDEFGDPVAVLLHGFDATFTASAASARQDGFSASAGCLLAARDSTSGTAAIRLIVRVGSTTLWDVAGVGQIQGDTITATTFEHNSIGLGGIGSLSGSAYYIDGSTSYSLSSPVASGTLSATLPADRLIGSHGTAQVNVTTSSGQALSGAVTFRIDRATDVYAPS